MRVLLALLLLLATVNVRIAHAQASLPGRSANVGVDALASRLRTGQRVWLTTDDGRTFDGYVHHISSSSIEILRRSGPTRLDMGHVRRIEVPDSIRDGVKRGALIGGLGMGIYTSIIATGLCECHDGTNVLITVTFAGIGAGSGALLGGLIDKLHVGRQTIFDPTRGTTVTIVPVVTPSHLGAAAAIRW
ncbi:MAG TPA: hypothetical protein VHD57_02705 [Vicinamibacterales bacterium]|jgi:hypothetical protein|nr:hypothetical protein [Vicinamibacterales bacterium]